MAVKTLNVSWNNFQNVAKDMFRQLKSDTDFTDVTLVSEDLVHIRAHKVILAASSDLFQDILRNTNSPNSLLYLKGVHHDHLEALMTFVYDGEVEVEEKNLEELMRVAMELQVKGLFRENDEEKRKGSSSMSNSICDTKNAENNSFGTERDSKTTMKSIVKRITKEKRIEESSVEKAVKMPKARSSLFSKDTKDGLSALKIEDKDEEKRKKANGQIAKVDENLVDLAALEDIRKDKSGEYSCPYCQFKNRDLYALRKHITTHGGAKFTCMWEGCTQKYSSTDSRKRHEKKAHSDSIGCDKCDLRFKLPEELKTHIVETHFVKMSTRE